MKKILLIIFLLNLPLVSFADIKVNWLPQVGISQTWESGDLVKNSPIFAPGFSGGAAVEVKFVDFFGIKAGVDVAQLIVRNNIVYGTPIYDSATGVTHTGSDTQSCFVMAEVPFLGMFYLNATDYLEIYGGIGVMPSLLTYNIVSSFKDNKTTSELSNYEGKYYTAFTADIGLHWNVGPGRVTAGVVYSFYNMSSYFDDTGAIIPDSFQYYKNNIKVYAGYLF